MDQDVRRHLALVAVVLVGLVAYGGWRMTQVTPPDVPAPPALPDEGLATVMPSDGVPGLPGLPEANDTMAEPFDDPLAADGGIPGMPGLPGANETGTGTLPDPELISAEEAVSGDEALAARTDEEPPFADDRAIPDNNTELTPTGEVPPFPSLDDNPFAPAEVEADISEPIERSDDVPADRTWGAPVAGRTYVVRTGDTLWRIARQQLGSATRWREIRDVNPDTIPDPDRLVVGTEIRLPGSASGTRKGSASIRTGRTGGNVGETIHIVQPGESPLQIAAMYFLRTQPDDVRRIRHMDGTALDIGESLLPGEKLRVPTAGEAGLTPSAVPTEYTVRPGDTLTGIARQIYGTSSAWRIILEANRDVVSSPRQLAVGTVLSLPPYTE